MYSFVYLFIVYLFSPRLFISPQIILLQPEQNVRRRNVKRILAHEQGQICMSETYFVSVLSSKGNYWKEVLV